MKANAFSGKPAVPAAISLCIGIAGGFFYFEGASLGLLWTLFAAFSIIGIMLSRRFQSPVYATTVPALFLGLILGCSSVPNPLPSDIEDTYGTLTGKVEKVTQTAESLRAVVHVESWTPKKDSVSQSADFNILCVIPGMDPEIKVGSELTATGKIYGLKKDFDIPYQTDYNRFLYIDGVVGRMSVYGTENHSVSNKTVSSTQRILTDMRNYWLGAIVDAGFDEPTTCFLIAVIGGDDILLNDDLEQQFRQTGLSHILAISGLHVAIILFVLAALLYPIKLVGRLRPVYFITLGVLVVLYALVTGGSPSACRAATMCCILLGNRLFEVKANPLQSLAVAVCVLLCIKPLWLFLPGFQLSVCAVLSIIAFAPLLNIVPHKYRLLRFAWGLVLIPIVALIGTLIPTLFYFHSFPVNFWLANVVASLFVPLLITIGFVVSLLALFGLYCFPLTFFGDSLYSLMDCLVRSIAGLSDDSQPGIFLDSGSLLIIGGIILAIFWLVNHYTHRRGVIVGVCCAIGILLIPLTEDPTPQSELYIPRYHDHTDVIIVHNGQAYLWSSAKRPIDKLSAQDECAARYPYFYKHRRVSTPLRLLTDGTDLDGLSLHNNILTLNGRTIVRIDNDYEPLTSRHIDIALISDHYRGDMDDILSRVEADSIFLSPAIHTSRATKYMRQLDKLGANYRNLHEKGLIWQFP